MFIKICGIRDVETARWVAALSPDAIGLNFYVPSPRCVTPDVAAEICRTVSATIEKVGVFVNHPAADVVSSANNCGLTAVQLHGDETPLDLATVKTALPTIKLIRAFRINVETDHTAAESWQTIARDLDECRTLGVNLFACLIDAFVPGTYGGTGRTIFEAGLTDTYDRYNWPPMILAGGLTPENIATAIANVRPWGVDVASGVESSPGVKDRAKVEQFIATARSAGSPV
ncbi:MAG: phosphoribosylanthranilate isomerase [Planctomycetaceae bacterium]